MKKAVGVAGVAAVALAAAALVGVGLPEQASGEDASARTVTVTGTGVVESQPDEAAFSFGVESRASTAREATVNNAVAMRRLIAALKAAGVADADLQTEHVSVWPDGKPDGGYVASGSVRVSIAVARASSLVDAATGAGATTLWGPTLTRGDTRELEERALERALADARRKAAALAEATGARLGAAVKLVEGAGAHPVPEYARALAANAAATAPPVEGGTVEQRATLTVTFALT